jgi:hypothetical protein
VGKSSGVFCTAGREKRKTMSYFQGLGATPGHKLPPEQLQRVVKALVELNKTTQEVVDKYVEQTPILSRATVREEWAEPFKESVQSDVVRLITPTRSGFYVWEARPQVLANLANSIDSQIQDMTMYRQELLYVSGNLRKLADSIITFAKEGALELTKEGLDLLEKSLAEAAKKPIGAVVAFGSIAIAVGILYLIKK